MACTIFHDAFEVRVYRVLIDPLIWPLRLRIVRLCRELNVREVLDIASATGAQCRMLAQTGMQATGVELSEVMVAAARRRGGRNTHYIHGSAYDLPFDNGSFDAALLLFALHEHTEKERETMFKQALRVLRPYGYLIIADYNRPRCANFHVAWQIIRLIEEMAGGEHRAGFKDFVSRGGLAGLLGRHALTPMQQSRWHSGAVVIAVIRRG